MHDDDTYQWRLRGLGAFLDTQVASYISLIETRNGFAVRYYQREDERDPLFVQVDNPQLRAINEALRQRRRLPATEGAGPVADTGPITVAGKYQDFLRALGWELDDLCAANITMDEQQEGVFVAYAFRDPETGQTWRKRVANLGPIERQQIMSEAQRRRKLR